ncbi:hypothetical protein [Streptomyces cyaneofuscatus]|uniref:hypothetical protein n=1 Tax=Streptomyces cyaneofuscatus TaxID=66883 RepID=UPI0033BE4109
MRVPMAGISAADAFDAAAQATPQGATPLHRALTPAATGKAADDAGGTGPRRRSAPRTADRGVERQGTDP